VSLAKNTEICSQNKLTRMDSPTETFLNLVWLQSIREVLFIADEAGAEIVMEPPLVLPSESFKIGLLHIQKQPFGNSIKSISLDPPGVDLCHVVVESSSEKCLIYYYA
jgi:hypothetical protein